MSGDCPSRTCTKKDVGVILGQGENPVFRITKKYVPLSIQRYILFSYPKHRVFPLTHNLTDELRRIYSSTKIKGVAYTKLAHWYKHVEDAGYDSFQVVKQTIYENYIDILNFFDNRSTNASAESFNAKIKNFRAQLRGISDVKYFLFRLQKIYA